MKLPKALSVLAVAASLLTVGCGPKSTAPADDATIQASLQLPGATNVMAALEKKEYGEAVEALLKIREGLSAEKDELDYLVLSRQVKDKLMELAPSDAKAAEALAAFRAATAGR